MIMRLRSRGISDPDVTRAIEIIPRSRFVTEDQRARAYEDVALPIPCGQVSFTPLLTAQFLQLARLSPETKTLIIGAGSGYMAGLATCLSRRVYLVERFGEVLAYAEANLLRAEAAGITARWGDGRYGWKANAPFDRILVTASLSKPPTALLSQLAPGGHLVGVIDGNLATHDGETIMPVLAANIPALIPGKSERL